MGNEDLLATLMMWLPMILTLVVIVVSVILVLRSFRR